jgi:predicted RNA-binding Zn-ribbon protein involved in translation (DUF1610 family)
VPAEGQAVGTARLKITTKVSGPRELTLPFECPCGQEIPINARSAAPGTVLTCPKCSAQITLTGDDMREAQKALDQLYKAFEDLGR